MSHYEPTTRPYREATHIVDQGAERALAALAHGAIAFALFGVTFLISLAISGVIWLYSKRSPEVRFHAAQASLYQCSVLLLNLVFITVLGVGGGFSIVNIIRGGSPDMARWVLWGLVFYVIWFFASILYGVYAAVMVLLGKRFKYPFIGNRYAKKVW